MKKYFNNDYGVSLLEVVASMLLLTILLLSFFYLFVQNAKVTSSNHANFTASAVARELSADITKKCSIVRLDKASSSICNYDTSLTQTGFKEEFPYQLTIQNMKDSSIIQTDYYRLRKVTIKVWNEDDDILTTQPKAITYTFQREVIK